MPESLMESADGLTLLSTKEAGKLLGITEEAVRQAVRSGRLDSHRLGDGPRAHLRIPSYAIAAYLGDAHGARLERR